MERADNSPLSVEKAGFVIFCLVSALEAAGGLSVIGRATRPSVSALAGIMALKSEMLLTGRIMLVIAISTVEDRLLRPSDQIFRPELLHGAGVFGAVQF